MNNPVSPTVTWSTTKSCCGKATSVCTVSKAIRKAGAQVFKDAGWFVPDNYFNVGIFWVKKDNFIVSATYGATQLHVSCSGERCLQLMKEFEPLILQAIQIK